MLWLLKQLRQQISHLDHANALTATEEQGAGPSRAPKAAPTIQWKPWIDGVETTDGFWSYVNFLLTFTTPNPQDKPIQGRMAKIGLVASQPWNPSSLGKDVSDAIAAGMKDALAELKKYEMDQSITAKSKAHQGENINTILMLQRPGRRNRDVEIGDILIYPARDGRFPIYIYFN